MDLNCGSVAVVTGALSGLVVVDIDPRNGGNESKKKLERLGNFSYTITVHTDGGGEHIYLRHPGPGQKIKSKLIITADIKKAAGIRAGLK